MRRVYNGTDPCNKDRRGEIYTNAGTFPNRRAHFRVHHCRWVSDICMLESQCIFTDSWGWTASTYLKLVSRTSGARSPSSPKMYVFSQSPMRAVANRLSLYSPSYSAVSALSFSTCRPLSTDCRNHSLQSRPFQPIRVYPFHGATTPTEYLPLTDRCATVGRPTSFLLGGVAEGGCRRHVHANLAFQPRYHHRERGLEFECWRA